MVEDVIHLDPEDPSKQGPGSIDAEQDARAISEQELAVAERMRMRDYGSSMTIIGADLIKDIHKSVESGDYEKLDSTINKALPLTEGLEFGIYSKSYGIPEAPPDLSTMSSEQKNEAQMKENLVYARLRNMFMTVEDSIDRGNTGYLRDAMLDALSRPIRELEEWEEDDGASWEQELRVGWMETFEDKNLQNLIEGENVLSPEDIESRISKLVEKQKERQLEKIKGIRDNKEKLLSLDFHVKSRFIFDSAFRQRQYVAHDRNLQANLKESIGLGVSEPDGTHWHGFYQVDSDWGEAVDKVEREMVDAGFKGYYTGNPNSEDFKELLNGALNKSRINGEGKRRMDVVWAAWKQVCFKELSSKFHMGTREDGTIAFDSNPPYISDLSSWLHFPEEHRGNEYGWNKQTLDASLSPKWDGKPIGKRTKTYRTISHSGHPVSIGHIAPNGKFGKFKLGNYMEFADIPENPNKTKKEQSKYVNMSLWEIWWGQDGNGLSQAHPDFPWIDTDYSHQKVVPDEAPQGSVGYWFLQRGRGWSILKNDVLGVRDVRSLESINNVATARNWDKLKMIKPEMNFKDDTGNPYAWKILADIAYWGRGTGREDLFNAVAANEKISTVSRPGRADQQFNPGNYLENARKIGLISDKEAEWIKRKIEGR